jgi:hypothetical protein
VSAAAGAAGAAAAAAQVQAVRASGAIVEVPPREFERIVRLAGDPIVVHAVTGVFSKTNQYLAGYKGLVFYAKSTDPLYFGSKVEVLESKKIWVP